MHRAGPCCAYQRITGRKMSCSSVLPVRNKCSIAKPFSEAAGELNPSSSCAVGVEGWCLALITELISGIEFIPA